MKLKNEILRQLIAIVLTAIIASISFFYGLIFPQIFVTTLFAVLGIFYSITMSLTISFDYRDVTNKTLRKNIRNMLNSIKTSNTINFLIATVILIITSPLLPKVENQYLKLLFELWPLCVICFSLVLSLCTFNSLFKLKNELEDAILKERNLL